MYFSLTSSSHILGEHSEVGNRIESPPHTANDKKIQLTSGILKLKSLFVCLVQSATLRKYWPDLKKKLSLLDIPALLSGTAIAYIS